MRAFGYPAPDLPPPRGQRGYVVWLYLVQNSTRVGVLLFAVLHRAEESQLARNSCPRLLHSDDSRIGLYHVNVVMSFLRTPIGRGSSGAGWVSRAAGAEGARWGNPTLPPDDPPPRGGGWGWGTPPCPSTTHRLAEGAGWGSPTLPLDEPPPRGGGWVGFLNEV